VLGARYEQILSFGHPFCDYLVVVLGDPPVLLPTAPVGSMLA
jgi:hypothetical protein